MKLTYNGFEFSQLGKVVVAGERTEAMPKENPEGHRRTLTVRVLTNQPDYVENFVLITQARQALSVANGLLQFTDDAGQPLIERNVTVQGINWPEEPNAWGQYHQVLEFEASYEEPLLPEESGEIALTVVSAAPNSAPLTLTGVEGIRYGLKVERYDPLRKHRRMADNRVELRGRHRAGAGLDLGGRRSYLLGQLAALQQLLRRDAEVVMSYGGVLNAQTCRVEDFQAEVDQSNWSIPWTLSARFTDFPNEAGYAQCEITISRREDKAAGTQVVTLTGVVAAPTELAAKAKWKTVRASALGNPGLYAMTRSEARPEQIDGADGAAFLKVTFEEEWQKQKDNLLSWDARMSDGEETATGMRPRTYSGSVTATGVDEPAAYAAAAAKAKELGANKHPILRNSKVEWASRQRLTGDDGIATVLVTVEYSYTYEVKGKRIYYQLSARVTREQWGQDATQVSGFVTAETAADQITVYQKEVLSQFTGRLLRSHEYATTQEAMSGLDDNGAPTPAPYTKQWTRADFSFVVLELKGAATARYEMEVTKDYMANEQVTRIMGTAWASSGDVIAAPAGQPEDAATSYVEKFLTDLTAGLSLGTKRSSRRKAAKERAPTLDGVGQFTGDAAENFTGLEFEEVWATALTGNNAIIQSSLTERVQPSGPRVAPQPTAESTTVIQVCGQTEGTREVRGSVTATTQTACETWIKRQRTVPLPAGMTTAGGRATTAVAVQFDTQYIPMQPVPSTDADWPRAGERPDGTKVQVVKAEFSFTEYYEQLGGGGWS